MISVDQKPEHRYFSAPPSEIDKNSTWFSMHGLSSAGAIFAITDILFSRQLLASMLCEAWNRNHFYEENDDLEPHPTETDRMNMIALLQQIASITGLLSYQEICAIKINEGDYKIQHPQLKAVEIPTFESLSIQCKHWRSQGLRIGCWHGSFDPVTPGHLSFATDAYHCCDKLIIGFDSDTLLRSRKGEDRPRFPLINRMKTLRTFWMVNGVFQLRAETVGDVGQFVEDYRALHVDYVFLSYNQEEAEQRLEKIKRSGAKPHYIPRRGDQFSATTLMRSAKLLNL